MPILEIVDNEGKLIMTIEGPVFPRKGVDADYLGYWLSINGEGQLLSADLFSKAMTKLYDDTF